MPKDFTPDKLISADLTFAKGILLLDQCENPTPWTLAGDGTDYDLHLRDEAAFFGRRGLRLRTRATGAATDDIVTATRKVPFPETNLLVYRMVFCAPDVSQTKAVWIRADFNDGSNAWAAAIKWLPNNKELNYLDKLGRYYAIDGYDQTPVDGSWIQIELVVQLKTHKYISVTFNGIKTMLETKSIEDEGAVANIYHDFQIGQIANTNAQSTIYFDAIYIGEFLNI